MARQRRPVKAMQAEQAPMLHRVAAVVSDWKAITGAVVGLIVATGVAYGFVGHLATKDDIAPLQAHVAAHDVEFGAMKQAIDDIRDTVHQIYDDQRMQSLPRRR